MITSNIISRLPPRPGSYGLVLYLSRKTQVTIGKLGNFVFNKGYYLYLGSAFGPGGLRARLGHHLAISKRLHWHIDYLRAAVGIKAIWMVDYQDNLEHIWAHQLLAANNEAVPVKKFGCSDCHCISHLFYFRNRPDAAVLSQPGIKVKVVHAKGDQVLEKN